ncbi:MAG: 1-acyl-sn-glycerol-3-phosphate acyltransferase [Pirellula sp.]|jgi:1-acyl-sn-glycerol-3-phosphate acyltransferase|nr:1-acyl-sn-glycerol-3-phosphate acyltransferase [Pirellula sp.]
MQDIIIEKPYQFVPPYRGNWLPWLILKSGLVHRHLRKYEGVVDCHLHGIDHLRESMRQGHGVLLAPNHCRYADPLLMAFVASEAKTLMYAMASWHLFEQSRFQRWAISTMGGFSVYREGLDRQSLDLAVEILSTPNRPLVVFPEGAVFRTNDLLQPLLDGVAFMTRTAAKRRAKQGPPGKVVIHPVAIKYVFKGNLETAIGGTLDSLENRLTWIKDKDRTTLQRIHRIILAMLCLKEVEYFGEDQSGTIVERQQRLVNHLLSPLEETLLGKSSPNDALIPRIKALRMKIVPELTTGELTESERESRWYQLSKIYLAQQIASYPAEYLVSPTTDTRILETVERLEEDLTDKAGVHGPLEAIIEIDRAIEVPADRAPRGEEDPIMRELRERLQSMLDRLSHEANSVE